LNVSKPKADVMAGAGASVVIPTYNGAPHVGQTIASVLAQTCPALELIVVDDGSNDGTLHAVEQALLGARLPVQVLRQPRRGVAAGRNAGLAAAQGAWVCFLDQDDLWHPRHLQTQFGALARHPEAGVIVSPYRHWYPATLDEHPPHGQAPLPEQACDADFTGWVYHRFLLDCWALTSASTIRKDVLQTHGAFDVQRPFSEDWDLWLRLSREVPFLKVQGPPVMYRQHEVQGSRVARPVDHRSELLESAVRRYGLASRDGRHVEEAEFRSTLARYEMEFGYQHLQHGDASLGVRSLLKAWRRHPARLRYLALAAAGMAGWRPARRTVNPPGRTP
jgi:glycosyltransferase involved in cell wall biosynthesis